MKSKLYLIGILFLFSFMIRHPLEAVSASKEGMKLWLGTLLPTLVPFFILSDMLTRQIHIPSSLSGFSKIIEKCFGLSIYGFLCLIFGLLCGLPVGIRSASQLYACQKISRREAHYLMTFSSQPGPVFLTSYLGHTCLKQQIPILVIYKILFTSNIVCMLFFRFLVYRGKTLSEPDCIRCSKKETSSSSPGAIIDVSIMNAFETITRIGGYILIFSLLHSCILYYWPFSRNTAILLSGMLELTSGLHLLSLESYEFAVQFQNSMLLVSFGGFCVLAQIKSILHTDLSVIPYISSRILHMLTTGILLLNIQFV